MPQRLRVALLIESSRSYGRQLLKGIAAYGRSHGSWTFFHQERAFGDLIPPRLREWKPRGIIARFAGARLTRQIRRMKLPAVDLYPEGKSGVIPGVASDPESIMCMAVGHFLERGFNNFAYCGFGNIPFSEKHLGRSPTAEIMRVQVQRVQDSLRTTTLTLEEISRRTGFFHVESMQRISKRMVGLTPGQYRKQVKACDALGHDI